MGLVLYLGVGELSRWVAMHPGDRAMRLVLWILAGAAVYGGVLLATGVRPRHLLEQHG
jgi:peptidoglycan biosynthesis protein MviN/MurJ (putative lipid II flippase)